MNTELCTGYFVGVNGKTTEYLVATSEGMFSCATFRRLPDEEAYDPECIRAVQMTYLEYILERAKSSSIEVRVGETNIKNVETDPIAAPTVPRRARLSQKISRNAASQLDAQGATNSRSKDQQEETTMLCVATASRQS